MSLVSKILIDCFDLCDILRLKLTTYYGDPMNVHVMNDGSGDFTTTSNWDEVSSRVYFIQTPSQNSIAVNEEFEVEPSSWNLSKGDKYIFRLAIYTTSGTHNVKMTGAMTIEEDWNDML